MSERTDPLYQRLCELYRRDPHAFEKERQRLIRDTIEGFAAENRRRAYGLQFKIDCQLRRYSDPVMRMNKMVEIFWSGVGTFQQVVNNPGEVLQEMKLRARGKVLPFCPRRETPET